MKRSWLAALGAACALGAVGIAAGFAVADGPPGSVSVATTFAGTTVVVPPQTFSTDVLPNTVTTIQTVTSPPVTVTVTTPGTTSVGTTTSTTTTTGTTTGPSTPTFESETSYTLVRPAFNVVRTVNVSTGAQLQAAVSNAQNGDDIVPTTTFTDTSALSILGSCTCRLTLTGVTLTNGVLLGNDSASGIANHWQIFGGIITSPSYGILAHGVQNTTWWGFYIHDIGYTGLAMFAVAGNITGNDFEGEITKFASNPSLDGHSEKGTGEHGANLADTNTSFSFSNNRVALDIHDAPGGTPQTHPMGGGVEIGDADGSPIVNDTLILRCRSFTGIPQQQTGGNCLQAWGSSTIGATVQFLQADSITGVGVYTGSYSKGSSITVEYGRVTNWGTDAYVKSNNGGTAWGTVTKGDVQPAQ